MAMPTRPRPEHPDAAAIPYYEGTRRGQLMLQRCGSCGSYVAYARHYCVHCLVDGSLQWVPAAGTGRVHTFTIVRQNPHPFFAERVPYAYAVIELDEGVRMVSNVVGIDSDDVKCEMRVRVDFERIDDEITVPVFRPID